MSFTAEITQHLPDGTRTVVWWDFVHHTGVRRHLGPRKFAAGADIQATLDAKAVGYEDRAVTAELRDALAQVDDGADPKSVPLQFVTRAALSGSFIRKTFNRMRNAEELSPHTLARLDSYTDAEIASATGFNSTEVAASRVQQRALKAALDDIDHGKGGLSE